MHDDSVTVWELCLCRVRDVAQSPALDSMEAGHKLDDHLRSPGLSEQFALMVDAHLVADGKLVPIHKSLLAAESPVFSDLFLSATDCNKSGGTDTFPMPGHTVGDICTFLQFLYKRTATSAEDTPSNGLWKSVEDARPIIQFAHKFNMQTILHECDTCLSQKAEADSEGIFKDNEAGRAMWTHNTAGQCRVVYGEKC